MTREDPSNRDRIGNKINRRGVLKGIGAAGAGITLGTGLMGSAAAAPGDKIGEVELPGHNSGVGLTFDGTYVYTLDGLSSDVLQTYSPPAGGNGTATQEAEKNIVDGSGNPVTISAVEWDPSRGQLWGAYNGDNAVYLLDIGDPVDGSQDAVATFQFAPDTGGFSLTDGLAYDARDDTLWYTPDVSDDVWHFQPDGTLIKTITPKNSDGNVAGLISGVAMGADDSGRPTLFCGRNGASEIIRVYADDGEFLESFANLPFRVEDLACDPVTYDSEAILTKDAYDDRYFALEVHPNTCPLPGTEEIEVEIDIKPCSDPNAINPDSKGVIPVAIKHTDAFDPNDPDSGADVSTLRFGAPDVVEGGDGASPAHGGHEEDVVPCKGDGDVDLVLHFPTEDTGFDGDEDAGRLEGETQDGTPLFGEDSVKIVGGGGGGGGPP